MLVLIRKFPFFKIVELPTPPNFDSVVMNSSELTPEQKVKVKEAKDLLILNKVPINKIRFVFEKTFAYDVDTDTVNPKYTVMHPRKRRKNTFALEIGKPENLMSINVGIYQTENNFETLKQVLKKSKRGVVVMLSTSIAYSGLDYTIMMANLDKAVEFHKNIQ